MKTIRNVILISLLSLACLGCTKPDFATEVLIREGYTHVEIQGYSWLGCGQDDIFATGFTARQNGQQVSGVVCSGYFKGATVRVFE